MVRLFAQKTGASALSCTTCAADRIVKVSTTVLNPSASSPGSGCISDTPLDTHVTGPLTGDVYLMVVPEGMFDNTIMLIIGGSDESVDVHFI
jgi:hypothetical protein